MQLTENFEPHVAKAHPKAVAFPFAIWKRNIELQLQVKQTLAQEKRALFVYLLSGSVSPAVLIFSHQALTAAAAVGIGSTVPV